MSKTTPDTIKALIEKAGKSFTGACWDTGPDLVVAALKRGDTKRAAEPDGGLDVPNDGSMYFGGLRQRWADLLRDCAASDGSNVAELLEEAEAIREDNAAYVKECAVSARVCGSEAIDHIDRDIGRTIDRLEEAVTIERQFGEAHSWEPALEAARAYAATLAEEDKDDDEEDPSDYENARRAVHLALADIALAEAAEAHETGDELTAEEVRALGDPVRFVVGAEAVEPDAMDPDALYVYRDGSVVACYPTSNHYYATLDEARKHYTDRDPVPSTPSEAWAGLVGSQSPAEFIANGGNVDDYTDTAPTCEALTTGERARVARLLRKYIEDKG